MVERFWGGGGYTYLAIGNSITIHPVTDFWWSECGMAASAPEYDYYHLVCDGLNEFYEKGVLEPWGNINGMPFIFYVWEIQSHDRTETYSLLDEYLNHDIDLITVQLSENCTDLSTFEVDFKSLLLHIKKRCGSNAEIIVIDDFWSEEKHSIKDDVCAELGISFVDLSDIWGNDKYLAGMGTIVTGDDGEERIIEHSGVAAHPGDNAMQEIAQRVLEIVNNN